MFPDHSTIMPSFSVSGYGCCQPVLYFPNTDGHFLALVMLPYLEYLFFFQKKLKKYKVLTKKGKVFTP